MTPYNRSRLGKALLLAGIANVFYSIRPTAGFDKIYFYWSFVYVNPFSQMHLGPGVYNMPAIVSTFEILLPWLIIGIALVSIGIALIARSDNTERTPTTQPDAR